jgi:hypothetical protein
LRRAGIQEQGVSETVAIVFYPESPGITPAIEEWQARNPDWRRPLDTVIICPVCGIPIRAIVDYALLDHEGVQEEIARYRDEHLRAACSDHWLPREEYWAMVSSRSR